MKHTYEGINMVTAIGFYPGFLIAKSTTKVGFLLHRSFSMHLISLVDVNHCVWPTKLSAEELYELSLILKNGQT